MRAGVEVGVGGLGVDVAVGLGVEVSGTGVEVGFGVLDGGIGVEVGSGVAVGGGELGPPLVVEDKTANPPLSSGLRPIEILSPGSEVYWY